MNTDGSPDSDVYLSDAEQEDVAMDSSNDETGSEVST